MCLGIPGRSPTSATRRACRWASSTSAGVRKDACLAYLPETRVGDYVIVHVGFAISHVDEEEALRTLEILGEMGVGRARAHDDGSRHGCTRGRLGRRAGPAARGDPA